MLAKINAFFQQFNHTNPAVSDDELTMEIACAVLLCEVMRADGHLDMAEQAKLLTLLSEQFHLETGEVQVMIEKALLLCENATDFYRFTSTINQHYTIEQRIHIVALLWQLAYADGNLSAIEEHIIRKIADLLHLRHHEYIQTKPKK